MADEMRDELESYGTPRLGSLCDGSGSEYYGRAMTSDGQMVLANGQAMNRDEVVAASGDAPTWDGYEISALRLVTTGRDSAALVYRGTAHRDGEQPFVGLMSSVYVQVTGSWRLALYTQTPVP